jgi:hypothetical protein
VTMLVVHRAVHMVCTRRAAGAVYRDALGAPPLCRGVPSRGGRWLTMDQSMDVNFPQPKSPERDAFGKPRCSTMVDPMTDRWGAAAARIRAQFDLCGYRLYR